MSEKKWPCPSKYETFEDYDEAWHAAFKINNPLWEESSMYTNGQYDELPYIEWENSRDQYNQDHSHS